MILEIYLIIGSAFFSLKCSISTKYYILNSLLIQRLLHFLMEIVYRTGM